MFTSTLNWTSVHIIFADPEYARELWPAACSDDWDKPDPWNAKTKKRKYGYVRPAAGPGWWTSGAQTPRQLLERRIKEDKQKIACAARVIAFGYGWGSRYQEYSNPEGVKWSAERMLKHNEGVLKEAPSGSNCGGGGTVDIEDPKEK
ncbi:MAG: hypothetical protein GY766_18500 [Herbaspirillum sp.]|uniref:hypothetical protein n=1 Tax=Herbaspirillum sp. TaxID=1890675 RepID=UPI00258E222B|nr:hypothetical protein [Herbaspirillum sp.]MCP3656855.1 hypothetical protein [Herbaspirillum sp.]